MVPFFEVQLNFFKETLKKSGKPVENCCFAYNCENSKLEKIGQ